MIYILTALFMMTVFLLFYSIFHRIFLSDKRLEKRIEKYLASSGTKLDRKQYDLMVYYQMTKQKVRKNMLTKEKNSKFETMLRRSGLPLKPEEYILFKWLSAGVTGFFMLLVSGNILLMVVGFFIGFLLPGWYVKKKIKERIVKFNEGLPDMISTIVGSLRAGFSFQQALKTVIEEAGSPIKEEMDSVIKEMQYGASLEDSLNELKERMPSEDLDLMIQAILIQRQVGGNLATVLDKIVQTIRERTKIHRQISSLTAQGRLSGIVIGLLPIILAFVLYLIEPEYIGTLFRHPIGIALTVAGIFSGIIGFVLIRKITAVEV
ncbi:MULTISPECIES: type II secretion system F family protein [unclassified Bacillus (in: firmicutes)]|uniref:type II secretion system F family protein n=1 Tax=unclassified Bacillus (in: firmicutes) TaxID=185979 RepID=UPI001BEA59E7|nr:MULTISPECIES: type II secretion system F family protein [unclassified Bacillus (in: firmicutes)]MBT2639971.1 type II secretion system F family protein [Bacillus sp. ISL-39]MBT2662889.1 type II secretion system F family protein [Bacillus sp. ISL-45]